MLAKVVHGHGAAAVDGEVHHLVKGNQLNSVELPIVDRLSTGKRWGYPTQGVGLRKIRARHIPERPSIQPLLPKETNLSRGLCKLWPDACCSPFLRPRRGWDFWREFLPQLGAASEARWDGELWVPRSLRFKWAGLGRPHGLSSWPRSPTSWHAHPRKADSLRDSYL